MEKQRIYFDMDGVLAVWQYVTPEELYAPGYFFRLDENKEIVNLARLLNETAGYEVYILSKARDEDVTRQKQMWLSLHMPFLPKERAIFVPLNEDKKDYIPRRKESDILIDDYNENLKCWHGISVKCLNGINSLSDKKVAFVHYHDTPETNRDRITRAIIRYQNEGKGVAKQYDDLQR